LSPGRPARAPVWKQVRILLLLLVLLIVAVRAWQDRSGATGWRSPLWVGLFPIPADDSPVTARYVAALGRADFTDIEAFFAAQAPRFGRNIEQPVHIELYPASTRLPPLLERGAGPVGVAWWSLKLRWFAAHAATGAVAPRIRLFVLYHDPRRLPALPDSHGMQKGLVGVVHVFADPELAGSNDVVIAHELLHTLGATDKYALGSGAPIFPQGFADPEAHPLYPQPQAEIMAGRRPLSPTEFEMPASLRDVVVGPMTAAEIRWTSR
jgi:hypothetical protein